jgi:hypothetical protein
MFNTNPGTASSINAVLLVGLGVWEMMESGSPLCLLPVFLGAIILVFSQGLRADNQTQLKLSLAFTVVIIISLGIALVDKLNTYDDMGKIRVAIMILGSIWAGIVYIYAVKRFR